MSEVMTVGSRYLLRLLLIRIWYDERLFRKGACGRNGFFITVEW